MKARLRFAAALAALIATLVALSLDGGAPAGAAGTGSLVAEPSLGAPARAFLGAAPQEASGEVFAVAPGARAISRYTATGGWELLPAPTAAEGGTAFPEYPEDASAGRTTPRGGIAAASSEALIYREPGGSLREAPYPEALLGFGGEGLFGTGAGRLLAVGEPGGRTTAFVVPEGQRAVLSYDGGEWVREEICLEGGPLCELPAASMRVVAIDAAGDSAWLLARDAAADQGIELFRRETGGGAPVWRQQPLGPSGSLGARYGQAEPLGVGVAARNQGQPLVVTPDGLWFDAVLTDPGGKKFEATAYYDDAAAEVLASWCDLSSPAGLCSFGLGTELTSGEGRSFAWVPSSSSGPYGTRTITGVGQGVILSLEGNAFIRVPLASGNAGSELGAARASPEEGWLGARPPLRITSNPGSARLRSWPVPFRRPLTAIAPAPGATPGGLDSEALAVGDEGQVARYIPGQGWEPEFLLRSSGKRATPRLRGVAWPEPGRAYAVGDGGAMWMWQKATGLWQVDPGAPPNLVRGNFTAIAFDPARPSRGYAVGKQGLLLGFGREWKQEPLPAGVPAEANFTALAFAGSEALATYKYLAKTGSGQTYRGGVIVNDGSGWRVDAAAEEALGGAPPQQVAGLPDGGAAIATLAENELNQKPAVVIERQGAGSAWQAAPGGWTNYPVALAAIREGGQVRAIASVVNGQAQLDSNADFEQLENQPPPGQAPLLADPYPLPGGGNVIRQTATGWRDEQNEAFPDPRRVEGQTSYDLPRQPDPILALLIAPDGSQGWAVGGETGAFVRYRSKSIQTAGVSRYGPSAAPPANASPATIPTEPGAVFALGGNAQCAAACADLAGTGIGPDRWLSAAVSRAASVPGMRAFLYTGASVAEGGEQPLAATLGASSYAREQAAYARRLGAGAGGLPVFAAPAASDLDGDSSLATFLAAFSGFGAPLGSAPAGAGIAPVSQASTAQPYYAFDSSGTGGTVRVVVLDYSAPALGDAQRCWLAQQISSAGAAGTPAIVVGQRDLAGLAPNAASDRGQVVPILAGASAPTGCGAAGYAASAYFFDYPEQTRAYQLIAGARSVPAFGSGTLGYVTPPAATETDFTGSSGFLLVSVGKPEGSANAAAVNVRLIPSIGALALNATDGTLLRRSQPALFQALARRPLAGTRCDGGTAPEPCELASPEPYVQIPAECTGGKCATTLGPEYTFTSSEPDVADFVARDPASSNPRNVLLVKKKPVLDSHSGLLCAFNAGTTTVTVSTGGLSYSQKVTVQAGSVQQPCGTTPLRNRNSPEPAPQTPPGPAPTPNGGPLPSELPPAPPPPPSSPAPAPTPGPVAKATPPTPIEPIFFPAPMTVAVPLVPIVPPPPLPAVQPTPPSGTSQVNAVEEEEEPEEATESSAAMAALPAPGPSAVPLTLRQGSGRSGQLNYMLPALVLVAAIAAGVLGERRFGRRRPRPAFQTSNQNRRYR